MLIQQIDVPLRDSEPLLLHACYCSNQPALLLRRRDKTRKQLNVGEGSVRHNFGANALINGLFE